MLICKDCRCYHPIQVSDRYCGECCIGETRKPIVINADVYDCCLYEPKQPKQTKKLTNADRIRQMTEHDLAEMIVLENICAMCEKGECEYYPSPDYCVHKIEEWLKQEAKNNDR